MVMKSRQKNLLSHPHATQNEISGDSIPGRDLDRRRFLQYVAAAGAVAGLGGRAIGQTGRADAANLQLPDNSQLATWEQPLTFSKTYYVDNQSAGADDNGPGTQQRPFRTIGKAAT